MRRDVSGQFKDCAIVTVDGDRMFVYTASRDQAEEAADAIEEEARTRAWPLTIDLRRWHPDAEEWKDPRVPMPSDVASKRKERDLLMERERQDTIARGYPEFEVRADLRSHHDAVLLADELREDGLPVVRRWRYLVLGAEDEDSAKSLADFIHQAAPDDAEVKVEGSLAAVRGGAPPKLFSTLTL